MCCDEFVWGPCSAPNVWNSSAWELCGWFNHLDIGTLRMFVSSTNASVNEQQVYIYILYIYIDFFMTCFSRVFSRYQKPTTLPEIMELEFTTCLVVGTWLPSTIHFFESRTRVWWVGTAMTNHVSDGNGSVHCIYFFAPLLNMSCGLERFASRAISWFIYEWDEWFATWNFHDSFQCPTSSTPASRVVVAATTVGWTRGVPPVWTTDGGDWGVEHGPSEPTAAGHGSSLRLCGPKVGIRRRWNRKNRGWYEETIRWNPNKQMNRGWYEEHGRNHGSTLRVHVSQQGERQTTRSTMHKVHRRQGTPASPGFHLDIWVRFVQATVLQSGRITQRLKAADVGCRLKSTVFCDDGREASLESIERVLLSYSSLLLDFLAIAGGADPSRSQLPAGDVRRVRRAGGSTGGFWRGLECKYAGNPLVWMVPLRWTASLSTFALYIYIYVLQAATWTLSPCAI